MFSTRKRLLAVAGAPVVLLVAVTAAASAAAGPPVSTQVLLCGTTQGFSGDAAVSGNSSIEHPSGLTASGQEFDYTGQNCRNNSGSSTGNFTWTIRQDNVNTATERGNEHADATMTNLDSTGGPTQANGFDGAVYEFDLPNGDFATCQDSSQVYYASGHAFDSSCSVGSGPGNFNTEGGAATGDHLNGKYGTLIYRWGNGTTDNSQCPTNQSTTYCFEAIIQGQQN
jgi:hypothetical protein